MSARTFAPFAFDAEHDALMLLVAGYEHEFMPAQWEDVGDVENGPRLDGHPDLDVYTLGTHAIVIVDGMCVAAEHWPQGFHGPD